MDEEDMRGPQTWGQQEDRNPYYGSMVTKPKTTIQIFLSTGGAYTVSSWFRNFVMGESGPSRVIKFLYAPERPEQGD